MNPFIKKHEPYIVLVGIDLIAVVIHIIAFIIIRTFSLFSNAIFSWYFVILMIPVLYYMFRAIIKAKDNSLHFVQVMSHFLLILFFITFTFTLVFLNPDGDNYLADLNNQKIWDNNSMLENILNSAYFSIITLSTLGYGDIHPVGFHFKIFSMIEVIIGWMFFIIVFANSFSKIKRPT